ncbi:MAG: LysR family transcriptional regulator [Clostridia bacterium]|nr:LysR family transcriptional regulator [Clostridia bacterium]
MNIVQLKYFLAVCTYQTVSYAADALHISQPSLSSSIKELENEFGVCLFKRHHKGMSLTAEGEILRTMAKDILQRCELTEKIMIDLGTERKKLRLGVPPMIGSLILPEIFDCFLSKNEDVSVDITEGGRSELIHKLSENYLDMVFLPHNREIDKNFSSLHISRLEIVCCASVHNPISKLSMVNCNSLRNSSLVLFENSFFQTEELKRWFSDSQVTPNILMQTNQLSTMLSMISNNIAVGFVFQELVMNRKDLVCIPAEHPMIADISLVWNKNTIPFNTMRRFIDFVKSSKFTLLTI